jgi:hypothetical protein
LLLLPGTCVLTGAKVAGLKATIVLLLILLMKSKLLRIKMSLLGSLLFLALLTGFLISTGFLAVVAGGSLAYASSPKQRSA